MKQSVNIDRFASRNLGIIFCIYTSNDVHVVPTWATCQAAFSTACSELVKNADAPELIRKILGQREVILNMESTDSKFLISRC